MNINFIEKQRQQQCVGGRPRSYLRTQLKAQERSRRLPEISSDCPKEKNREAAGNVVPPLTSQKPTFGSSASLLLKSSEDFTNCLEIFPFGWAQSFR